MIALFFAMRIINEHSTFNRVPRLIEDDVRQILEDKGCGHLAIRSDE